MPKVTLKCHYCGTKWNKDVFISLNDYERICEKCGDDDIEVLSSDEDDTDVFGYYK